MDTLERWPSARQRESIPRPMELAIISDTHLPRGNRHLPPTCVEHLRRADLIIHAGDLRTLDVLAELESLGAEVAAIHGNVDEAAVRAQLPATRIVAAGGVRIAIIPAVRPSAGGRRCTPWVWPGSPKAACGSNWSSSAERVRR